VHLSGVKILLVFHQDGKAKIVGESREREREREREECVCER